MREVETGNALTLASWILARARREPEVTHLKLQKLAFYCYGAALGLGLEHEVGHVTFQAWKHGPVSPEIYHRYSPLKGAPLEVEPAVASYSSSAEQVMMDILNVYGRMTAWQLREETHSEQPWLQLYDGTPNKQIPTEHLREYFSRKFGAGLVRFPERLFGTSSMALDRIPVPTFPSLRHMSEATSRILGA